MEREDLNEVEQFTRAFFLEPPGTCCQKLGRLHEAVLHLAAGAGLGNRQFRARFLLAEVLVSLGDIDGPVNKLEEAIELNSNFRRARDLWTRQVRYHHREALESTRQERKRPRRRRYLTLSPNLSRQRRVG
jgi:hypothetical protein